MHSSHSSMEILLTSQAEAIVNRHLAMGYSSMTAVIEEALRQTHLEIIRILYDGMDLKRHFPSDS